MKNFIHIIWYISFLVSVFCVSIFLYSEIFSAQKNNSAQEENYLAFMLDVSQSMKVWDMDGTSRLVSAKQKISEIISDNRWYNFSLSIFAWESQRVLPFTQDVWLFTTFLSDIDSDNLTIQWTDLKLALRETLEGFLHDSIWNIVILTDGDEENIKIDSNIMNLLKQNNIQISFIGIWSKNGWGIPTWNIKTPYKKYEWKIVSSKLNRIDLQQISSDLGWKYYDFDDTVVLYNIHTTQNTTLYTYYWLLLAMFSWGIYLFTIWQTLYYAKY